MQRLEKIQQLYNATCANRLSGNPNLKLSPSYYSIYSDNRVEKNEDIVRSVVGDPEYIICLVKASEPWNAGNELFCFIDRDGKNLDGISLAKWKLKNIAANMFSKIMEINLLLLDSPNEYITLKFNEVKDDKKLNVIELWQFMTEIDVNCKNFNELEIYKKYFLAKTELDKTQLSLAEFQHQYYANYTIVNQYKDLLQKIEKMVAKQ